VVVYICVVSGRVHLCCKWSCLFVLYVVVYICVVSDLVYLFCKWSCIYVL
jgi:hypothetical protein